MARPWPSRLIAGDTAKVTVRLVDYPASEGWRAVAYLSSTGEVPKSVPGAASGDDHTFAFTVDMAPGGYRVQIRITDGAATITLPAWPFEVLPDPSTAFDRRTHAEKALAAVTAVLEGRLSDPLVSYELDGVKAAKIPPADLLKLRDRYAAEVRIERGQAVIRPIGVSW